MKKILLATTALVGFAGAAAAEVSLSGYAEIGIAGGAGSGDQYPNINGVQEYQQSFWNDFDVTFNLSGEADNGLTFGATMDLDESVNGWPEDGGGSFRNNVSPGNNYSSVWVSGSWGTVTVGDTDGALDYAVPEIYMGTSLADDHSSHSGSYWNSGLDGFYDGQVARYNYAFGDFGVAVSLEMDDTGQDDPVIGLGGKWGGDFSGVTINAGLGYQTNGDTDVIALGANFAMENGIVASLGYADTSDFNKTVYTGGGATTLVAGDFSWWGVAAGFQADAWLVQANYGEYDGDAATGSIIPDSDGWGLVANYDLGGGAVAMLGYGSGSAGSGNGHGDQTYSFGLGLSF